jgi:molybdopterin-guanine dinucleotide biosynthesis protein A
MSELAAVVLCGGRSTRMGQPKAWLDFAGQPLLQRIVAITAQVADPVVVVAAPAQELPSLPAHVELVRDEVEGRGPLQGIAAGLATVAARAPIAYVSGTDTPLLQPAFVRRLAALAHGYDAVVPEVGGQVHPLSAVYATRLAPLAQRLLLSNRRAARSLIGACHARLVNRELLLSDAALRDVDPELRSLHNVNTHEEYEWALARGFPLSRE